MKRIVLLSVLVIVVGCDPSVDAFKEGREVYSLYGALNIHDSTNYIRVRNISDPFTKSSTKNINVNVKLVDVESGVVRTLRDSVKEFQDVYTHNFESKLNIEPFRKYEAILMRDGEERLRETALTPKISSTNVDPVHQTCKKYLTITFSKIIGSVDVAVGVEYEGEYEYFEWRRSPDSSETTVTIYTKPEFIILRALGPSVANQEGSRIRCHDLSDDDVRVKYTVYGPDFFEGVHGEQLDLPDKLGRFGGFYRDQFEFKIDTTDVYRNT